MLQTCPKIMQINPFIDSCFAVVSNPWSKADLYPWLCDECANSSSTGGVCGCGNSCGVLGPFAGLNFTTVFMRAGNKTVEIYSKHTWKINTQQITSILNFSCIEDAFRAPFNKWQAKLKDFCFLIRQGNNPRLRAWEIKIDLKCFQDRHHFY